MENSIYIALSRQAGVQREMDVIANNVANANTDGFKREQVMFREFVEKPRYREAYSFTDDVGNARDMTVGPVKSTTRPLDMSLGNEEAFFVVQTPAGERYTRHGSFVVNANGQLSTAEGYLVLGTNNNPIDIPETSGIITISGDGAINSDFLGPLANLQTVRFDDSAKLRRGANNLYIPQAEQAPIAINDPKITQGTLEGSNVSPILEITRMISIARDYEAISKFSDKEDERIGRMLGTVGTPFGS